MQDIRRRTERKPRKEITQTIPNKNTKKKSKRILYNMRPTLG